MKQEDLSIAYPRILQLVDAKHQAYLGKYGNILSLAVGSRELLIDRVYAKLSLVAKAFNETSVIDGFQEVEASSATGDHPRSIMLRRNASRSVLYLLNDYGNVIVADSIGIASMNPLAAGILLITESKKVLRRHKDVLSEDFNWVDFSMDILDAIHSVLYDRSNATRILLEQAMRNTDDGDSKRLK